MHVGDKQSWERTFTENDVEIFGEISGDRGAHHVLPDEQGRVMVQGLLTATLPSKIGGDWNYIASEMNFEFVRPVFIGDTIRCEATIAQMDTEKDRVKLRIDLVCLNQRGKEVLRGKTAGIIRQPEFHLIGHD